VERPAYLYPLSVENVEMIAAAAAVVMVRICQWVASYLVLLLLLLLHGYNPYYCSTFDQMTESLFRHYDVKHHLDCDYSTMACRAGAWA
jgi:hypothetical protein